MQFVSRVAGALVTWALLTSVRFLPALGLYLLLIRPLAGDRWGAAYWLVYLLGYCPVEAIIQWRRAARKAQDKASLAGTLPGKPA